MIDEQRALELYGYVSGDLKPNSNKSIVGICENCGRYRVIPKHVYINAKHSDLCQSCCKLGNLSPSWKGGEITKICEICEKEFETPPGSNQRFCSRKCSSKWISENICGKNSLLYKPKITLMCEICGKKYKVIKSKAKRSKVCSLKCKYKWMSINFSGKNSVQWQGGLSFGKYCNLWTESFREQIRNQFHNKCFLCNKSKENNKRNLDVHHVNYDKNCLCQKTCEFVPLCHSCHSKTNHNRQYWEDLIMGYLYPERYFMANL